jgi:ribonucleotide reductase, class II
MKHLKTTATSPFIFYRSYSRFTGDRRESWQQMTDRCIKGLTELGKFTPEEADLVRSQMDSCTALPSGRYMWCGGTEWSDNPENYSGTYNCNSSVVDDIKVFGYLMNLAAQGTGTGAVLELENIAKLPPICNQLNVEVIGEIGTAYMEGFPNDKTKFYTNLDREIAIVVGDSRQGWVDSYQKLIELATDPSQPESIDISVDLSFVRPAGTKLKGFGGTANPIKLPQLYGKVANILNGAIGRQLNSIECCMLIDEASLVIVAGNVRRCLPEESLVHTINGLVPIKEICVGDLVQTPIGYRKVTNKFDQGIQNVYDLDTNGGFTRATLNHQYAIFDGIDTSGEQKIKWTKLSDIQKEDRLLFNRKILPGSCSKMPVDTTANRPNHSTTCKPISIPDLDTEIAWLVGYTHGNGCIQSTINKHNKPQTQCSWSFNRNYGELGDRIADRIISAIAKFGIVASRKEVLGENTSKVTCTSARLAEYFQQHIKKPNMELKIPSFILGGSSDIRAAYMAGVYDADGAQNNRPAVAATTIYKAFARQLTALLGSLGVPSRISITTDSKNPHWNAKYNITLPSLRFLFNDRIAIHSLKGCIKTGGHEAHGFSIPAEMICDRYSPKDIRNMGAAFSANLLSTVNISFKRFSEYDETSIDIPVTFKELSSVDVVQTWDIEVEEAHCFYADGYLMHNSAGIRQFSSNDEIAKDAKLGLWKEREDGTWYMPNPERDALRMANHTTVYHHKPTLQECVESVSKQYYSGEGAIQWAGEAVARANVDILNTPEKKKDFLDEYHVSNDAARDMLEHHNGSMLAVDELDHRMNRYGGNPCALGSMELLTVDGYQTFESLDGKDVDIINASGQVSKSKVWCSGIKETIEITFEGRLKPLICTPDHQLMDVNGNTVLAGESKGFRLMPFTSAPAHDPLYVVYGIVQGDGVLGDLRNPEKRGVNLCVGDRDADFINILDKAGLSYTVSKNLKNVYINNGFADRLKVLGFSDKKLPERELPSTFSDWTIEQKKAFLNGVFTANGCIHSSAKGRISLKGTCKPFIDSIQSLLAELNIQSYVTVNKPKVNKFHNGEYTMKQSYDLNIQQYFSRSEFSRLIGFSLDYKSDLLAEKLIETAPKVRLIRPYGKHKVYDFTEPLTHWGIVNTVVFHNCFEVVGCNFMCNLAEIHLNTIDPFDLDAQRLAFKAASLSVGALLHHEFTIDRYQKSRELDPIVGVSFTGLFDFFVHLFGVEWLQWWQAGRPESWGYPVNISNSSRYGSLLKCDFIRIHHFDSKADLFLAIEEEYLSYWKSIVFDTVSEYCDRHNLKCPNRSTLVQPAGSKSLLTGASAGWAPPKAVRYIRRMTFGKNEPIALAAIDLGYNVIPSQSDKDEHGNLLDDIHDPLVTEWLVEIPVEVSWANLPGASDIDLGKFSALAQFNFYMQVQRHYSTHTTSATIELQEHEIEPLATAIYQDIENDGGYMSAALLARFDAGAKAFPRLPFEPIDKATYDDAMVAVRMRRVTDDFDEALALYDRGQTAESGPSGCDSDKCMMPDRK